MAVWPPDGDNTLMITFSLKPYAWLFIGSAFATMVLKRVARPLTSLVGLLANGSLVQLAVADNALAMLSVFLHLLVPDGLSGGVRTATGQTTRARHPARAAGKSNRPPRHQP